MNASCVCPWRRVAYAYVQIPFGFGAFLLNLAIVATLARYRALRDKYFIVGALAFADSVEGFATLLAGIWRSVALQLSLACTCVSPLFCMSLPQSWLWRWAEISTAYMLLACSFDRLYAVHCPLQHLGNGLKLGYTMVAVVFSTAVVNTAIAWVLVVLREDLQTMPAFCSSSTLFYKSYYQFNKYSASLGSFLSVLVFGLVWHKYVTHSTNRVQSELTRSKNSKRSQRLQADSQAAQRRLTKTLVISSAATLILDALPRAYGIYIDVDKNNFLGINKAYFFQLTKVSAMANFFIYALRHAEIKMGLKALAKNKTMPENLSLWRSE